MPKYELTYHVIKVFKVSVETPDEETAYKLPDRISTLALEDGTIGSKQDVFIGDEIEIDPLPDDAPVDVVIPTKESLPWSIGEPSSALPVSGWVYGGPGWSDLDDVRDGNGTLFQIGQTVRLCRNMESDLSGGIEELYEGYLGELLELRSYAGGDAAVVEISGVCIAVLPLQVLEMLAGD